jgi:flagellin
MQADMAVTSLGVSFATVGIGQSVAQSDLDDVVAAIDGALLSVDTKRAHLGAISNRFGHIMNNLQNVIDNTTRSKSIIIDADFSIEATHLTRTSVLQQGATSMLAQANSQKNLVLSLFQ